MTKEQMIVELIENEIEVNYSDISYIRDVLRSGFKGYDNMTDDEVKKEWEEIQ